MDLITSLSKFDGCGSIMVIVDCYSKYTTFIAALANCKVDEATPLSNIS